ncbi:purine and uridine phosphorylase [Lentithecium fluviatile CBS 122367]|uniref:Purine and uridine phosphorylase n=1 Tax=Lentithecium fluviatile CBS 122367 TaxID=1168545 RepID=A0A6G1IDL0_9PLEO|nr:purine and uridine phosphorylase [Lentithecium fluviatile CBS 122367]
MQDPGEYTGTVGCICAFTTEAVSLRAFFNEEHGPLDVPHKDKNIYSAGRMAGHNLVVATLPFGRYGMSQATSFIGNMVRSFPNLRFCLMVGIGGGVPNPHDVRLGDVVISALVGRTGGVLQYDHSKAIQNQPFRSTQHLNEPPDFLLSAINKLIQNYELEGHPLQDSIGHVLANRPRLKAIISVQETRATYFCGTQDSKLAKRLPRAEGGEIELHYGIIASGSSLMKDARTRDRLAKDEEALCFEMEAAGLMNKFLCLVIRGICDYSDSHKNDDWHGYAAMAAAAYAKELLRVLRPSSVEREKQIQAILQDVGQDVKVLKQTYTETRNKQKRHKILNWLPSHEDTGTHNRLREDRMTGAGKTIIASTITHHLQTLFEPQSYQGTIPIEDADAEPLNAFTGIAYIYCSFRTPETKKIKAFLGSILKQLAGYI